MYNHVVFASAMQADEAPHIIKAQALAAALQAKFSLVHIYEIPGSLQLAQGLGFAEIATPSLENLQTLFATYAAGFNINSDDSMVITGELWPSLADAVKRLKADLLIIGEHHAKLSEIFLHHKNTSGIFVCDVLTMTTRNASS